MVHSLVSPFQDINLVFLSFLFCFILKLNKENDNCKTKNVYIFILLVKPNFYILLVYYLGPCSRTGNYGLNF